MTRAMTTDRRGRRRGRGMTLVELVVAGAAATVLMLGLMSCFLIAGRALDEDQIAPARQIKTAGSLEGVLADLRDAISFSERTANAVTFQVPDRDGDTLAETIRYSWSGTAGDPLMMEYNGSAPVALVADVKQFDLAYALRTMTGTGFTKGVFPPDGTVLFVSGGTAVVDGNETTCLPTAQEQLKIALIESWNYTIETIHCTQVQADFDAAIADANVAYVSLEISDIDLDTKLRSAPIGIVIEKMMSQFGVSSGWLPRAYDEIKIIDNSHYITFPFSVGLLTYLSSIQPVTEMNWGLAPGLTTLASVYDAGSNWEPALAVIDVGGELAGGGTAAGRRVQLPWGDSGFDFNALTDDGKLIMQRAIEWAADPSLIMVTDIYVYDIGMGSRTQASRYYGQATIEVREDRGGAIAGATVTGAWSGAVTGTDQGVTGADGRVMLESSGVKGGGTFTFTVTDVSLDGHSYNASLNWETSDWITVP